jgi:hypothetical protein
MKTKTSSNVSFANARRNTARSAALLMAVTLVATVAAPLGVRAQVTYNGGTAEIEFDGEPVAAYGGANPLWVGDTITLQNDVMSSPGGGFNEINYANAPIYNSGPQALGALFAAGLGAGNYAPGGGPGAIPFGGGVIALTPTLGAFAINEVAPGAVSVGISVSEANFTIGPGGIPGAPANVGTFLSIGGGLNANSAIAGSLVTYIQDNTTGFNATLAEVLGATGIASPATQNLSGSLFGFGAAGIGIPAMNGANSFMLYGPGDTTYTGLAAADVATAANFLAANDNVTITSVFTAGADPDASIDSEPLPSDLLNVTLPGDDLYGTELDVPEPGTLSLVGAGLSALLAFTKRSRA